MPSCSSNTLEELSTPTTDQLPSETLTTTTSKSASIFGTSVHVNDKLIGELLDDYVAKMLTELKKLPQNFLPQLT